MGQKIALHYFDRQRRNKNCAVGTDLSYKSRKRIFDAWDGNEAESSSNCWKPWLNPWETLVDDFQSDAKLPPCFFTDLRDRTMQTSQTERQAWVVFRHKKGGRWRCRSLGNPRRFVVKWWNWPEDGARCPTTTDSTKSTHAVTFVVCYRLFLFPAPYSLFLLAFFFTI